MRLAVLAKMKSGKDVFADYLKLKYPGNTYKMADPLYEMQKAIYEIAGLPYPEDTKDRLLLQFLGTDWGRRIDENIWLNIFEKKIAKCSETDNIFCTDIRFPNELKLVKTLNFTTVKIITDNDIRIKRGAKLTAHESERYIDLMDADIEIYNNGTLEEFYKSIDATMEIFNKVNQ